MKLKGKDVQKFLKPEISRRGFLKLGLLTAVAGVIPQKTSAYVMSNSRSLSIYNLHTKEYFNSVYWYNGRYISESLKTINFLFRDHYNGRVRSINPDLLDLLYVLHKKLGSTEPFHLISGYRTESTNARLRRHDRNVARNSLHMFGMAADIRLPGCNLKILRRAAYKLKGGGVGYYPRRNFVHLDVGKIRYW